ncbi:MAG: ribosome recycling factor [Bacteroidetes bacterium]|nr:MAG: ribosome recycling factor [Bacteroidota bacterium]PIE88514.1 MAG: ribosome recycling factor [Bacteroidota bacterium]
MTEDAKMVLDEAKEGMQNALTFLEKEYQKLRAGKATPDMLDGVKIDYYGTLSPINQVANVTTPDPKQIIVQPWDKNMLPVLEKAIMAANLGFNPVNNGEVLRIIVPPLTEERRKEIVKKAKQEAEQAKVSIRSVRKSAMDMTKELKNEGLPEDDAKKLEEKIQEHTNDFSKKVETTLEAKEKDIMTV